MRHNLGKIELCGHLVTTRTRCVHKQDLAMPGSQRSDTAPQQKLSSLEIYVESVSIKVSVQNGESATNDLEYGEDLLRRIGKLFANDKT